MRYELNPTNLLLKIFDTYGDNDDISPTDMAAQALRRLEKEIKKENPNNKTHPLMYGAADQHFRQLARAILREKFPMGENDGRLKTYEFFSNRLQAKYPAKVGVGENPIYRPLERLTKIDATYNARRFTRDVRARTEHLNAFLAVVEKRFGPLDLNGDEDDD